MPDSEGGWVTYTPNSEGGWVTYTPNSEGGWVTYTPNSEGGWVTYTPSSFSPFLLTGETANGRSGWQEALQGNYPLCGPHSQEGRGKLYRGTIRCVVHIAKREGVSSTGELSAVWST